MQYCTPILYTKEIQESIDFYTQYLQFKCTQQADEFAYLEYDDISIMFSLPNPNIPFVKPQFTGTFYFQCDDVNLIWDFVGDVVQVCYPIQDFAHGMREFAIYDNNGYLLQFGQEIRPEES